MMTRKRWRVVTVLLAIGMAAAGSVVLADGAAFADAPPAAVAPSVDVSQLSPEAARLYPAVRNPQPNELRWQQIPWLVDLEEGIRVAKAENRPLLLFVSGDDPLEKC